MRVVASSAGVARPSVRARARWARTRRVGRASLTWTARGRARATTARVDAVGEDGTRARARVVVVARASDGARAARGFGVGGGGKGALAAVVVWAWATTALAFAFAPRASAAAASGSGKGVTSSVVAVERRTGAIGAVDALNGARTRVRAATQEAMLRSLRAVGTALEKFEAKTQEDWVLEDVWVLFAWNWLIRRGREKAHEAWEKVKGVLNGAHQRRPFEGSFFEWLKAPMQLVQGLFILSYIFDVGCAMLDMLSPDWDIPEAIKLGFDKGAYTFTTGMFAVMWVQHYGPSVLGKVFPAIREDASLQLVITRLTSAFVIVTTLMLTLAAFGIPAKVLFSFGGLGGLAFGLAAKDFISNLIGGLVLAVMRPFKVGEKIYLTGGGGKYRDSKDKEVSNYKVAEIGWYQTKLIPKDGKVTTIPNGYFLGANVINTTREPNEYVGPQLRIALSDYEGVPALTRELRTFLAYHPDVNSKYKAPLVVMKSINEDHLLIQIEMFMYSDRFYGRTIWKEKRQDVLLDILNIIKKHCPNSPALPTLVDNVVQVR